MEPAGTGLRPPRRLLRRQIRVPPVAVLAGTISVALAACSVGAAVPTDATAPVGPLAAIPEPAAPSAPTVPDGLASSSVQPSDPGGRESAQSQDPAVPLVEQFADADGVPLQAPSATVAAFAYHESLFDTAMKMTPRGRPAHVDYPSYRPPTRTSGPDYIVMRTRGRPTGPTTAVDIVLGGNQTVLAPVSGEVVDSSPYLLYCETPDRRVVIRPDGYPQRRVVIFHLRHVQVNEGDAVVAGQSALGRPRVFHPHSAEYDAYVPGGKPHVHVEVEKVPGNPTPGCPAS